MEFNNKRVLVYGLGKSGIGAARLLLKHQAKVMVYDTNNSLLKEEIFKELETEVEVYLGKFPEKILNTVDLVVLSPGVPTSLPEIKAMKEKDIKVIGEIELAWICSKGEVLAITGTNGKTTSTTLLGEIIKEYNKNTFVVGNIGIPYTKVADQSTDDSAIVAEISSFQLETIDTFHPKVSAILNVTPDHLDRHLTMENYAAVKKSITKNQDAKDYCILNYEDKITRKMADSILAKVIFFSSKRRLDYGAFLEDDKIIFRDKEDIVIANIKELNLLGTHNYENIMAVTAMAYVYGVPVETIRSVLLDFMGVPHRIEYIGEYKGIAYYNDSKGTNPDAAIKAVKAMNRPTVLIAGGYDKKADYKEWIDSFHGKVKELILLGETKEDIARDAAKEGFDQYVFVDTFEEGVEKAIALAKEGDAVLLSPACASWGMFNNYEERGDRFKELVKSLNQQ